MKKFHLLGAILFGFSTLGLCQSIGIGTGLPNSSAQLDITSSVKGFLIPRMNTAGIASISNPAKGLLVYDSARNQLMVNMGTSIAPDWQNIVAKSGWNLTGNNGTNQATNFIGTTDASPLILKFNNVKSGFIDSGTNNTGIGFRTLDLITTGTDNLALGYKSLISNSSGVNNTAVGSNSLLNNTTGNYNTASGTLSIEHNITGDLNAAYGAFSLNKNTVGTRNTAIGTSALYWNTGSFNTGLGFETLNQNTTGTGNTALGTSALWNNQIGYSNVAIGASALYHNVSGFNLVAVGDSSLFSYDFGLAPWADNTAVGSKTLFSNTNGYENTAIGGSSLYSNTTGLRNTALGSGSLVNNIIGSSNTAIGFGALRGTTASNNNTVVGASAAYTYDLGYNNTLIGALCNANATGLYNCVALGEAATCTASSQARIGNSSTTSIGGQVGWTTFSDGRYKKNVQENVKGTDFIMKLHPVTYQLDVQGISNKLNESRGREMDAQSKQSMAEKEKIIFSGFVAQEVEKAARESGYDFSGVDAPKNENDFYGLRYGDFVVPLVKTVQEQQAIIQQQQGLNDKQQQTINDLQTRLQSLEEQVKLLIQSSNHKN